MNNHKALTLPQLWALQAIADGFSYPSSLGERMMERPGAVPAHRRGCHYKAQGYGRMGGVMIERLRKKGLVWATGSPTKAILNSAGRSALSSPLGKGE